MVRFFQNNSKGESLRSFLKIAVPLSHKIANALNYQPWYKKMRGDMIQTCQFFSGSSSLRAYSFLKMCFNCGLWGHSKQLVTWFFGLDFRKFSFYLRLLSERSSLREWVVKSSSLYSFKVNIDKDLYACRRIWILFLSTCLFGYGGFSLPFPPTRYIMLIVWRQPKFPAKQALLAQSPFKASARGMTGHGICRTACDVGNNRRWQCEQHQYLSKVQGVLENLSRTF